MHHTPQLFCAIGVLAVGFAYWGIKTAQGQRMFDEMAGMLPWGAGVLGLALLLIGGVWWFLRSRSQ